MHTYQHLKLRGKLIFSITLISLLFVIPYLAYFIVLSTHGGDLDALTNTIRIMTPILILSFVVIWLISLLLAIRFSKQIAGPIQEISKASMEMCNGSLSTKVHYEEREDEIGALANSINTLSQDLNVAIREIIFLLDAISKGDLTVESRVALKGDWSQINTALRDILDSLNATFTKVSTAADQTASGSEQVASGSQGLAQGATEQASAIEQLSATILEVSDHVKKNAANAAEANRFSSEEEQKLETASTKMNEMMKAMSDISDTSKQIGNIIKTIDDIAFQTNILALNAAVEAARAGAAGKGFAVVADEVRNLASKSAEAAKNTTSLIENAIKAVGNGSKVADTTEKTLLEVIQSASRTNSLVNEIASASNQQATSIGQITQGIQQISAVVQTNSATAEESAAASEELAAQAKELKRSVSGVKLRNAEAATPKASEKGTARVQHSVRPSEAASLPAQQPGTGHKAGTGLAKKAAAAPVAVSAGGNDKYI